MAAHEPSHGLVVHGGNLFDRREIHRLEFKHLASAQDRPLLKRRAIGGNLATSPKRLVLLRPALAMAVIHNIDLDIVMRHAWDHEFYALLIEEDRSPFPLRGKRVLHAFNEEARHDPVILRSETCGAG